MATKSENTPIYTQASPVVPLPTDTGALANRINFHTRELHSKADAFVSAKFAVALRHPSIYRQGLLAMYYIFRSVEQHIDRLLRAPATADEARIGEILRAFWRPEFARAPALVQDFEVYYAAEYSTSAQLHQFLDSYELPPRLAAAVADIEAAALRQPWTILAHCHVLYLALFAGGRVMRSALSRQLGLLPRAAGLSARETQLRGTHFFTFGAGAGEENKARVAYKRAYELATRTALSEAEKADVIDAARADFDHIQAVMAELAVRNRQELLGSPSYRLLTFLGEEWRYRTKNSPQLLALAAVLSALFLYAAARVLVARA
ncbi:ACL154Wp [Eremothecium gossypii ATCC 10895]|uniref:ACL154Wp n=1 Tax=Eremothecium gossypii (strain ATCC 10895 / CBS 109.51 / FGSC 9923 / NRRL Y-1056) TaxID=284811 RepID=Q75CS3_EREGS|nr:ACL154Wp [Eremothecium gossypii ATCC 10895]AAS51074.1 ACL154Wp [Eremothecium gossypii ATCC 10895]AEY95364.1 FACL154Wp [Eremothecium gossypii FDAG1]